MAWLPPCIFSLTPPPPPEATHWRFHFKERYAGTNGDTQLTEIELLPSIGGSDVTTPGTPISSSSWNGNAATSPLNAINNDFSTDRFESDGQQDFYLSITLPTATKVPQYNITFYNTIGQWPVSWDLEYSTDGGTNWNVWHSVTDYRKMYSLVTAPFIVNDTTKTFLLHQFNGTPGDEPNLYDDTGKRTLTKTGTALLSSISKFGSAVRGDSSATVDTLKTDLTAEITLREGVEFTAEGWFRVDRSSGDTEFTIWEIEESASFYRFQLKAYQANTSTFKIRAVTEDSPTLETLTTAGTFNTGQFYHYALVGNKVDGTAKLYIDGVLELSPTRTEYITGPYRFVWQLGASGRTIWHDCTRFVEAEIYTTNFTPPTDPLTVYNV